MADMELEDRLRSEHGEIWEIASDLGTVYIRCPDRALFRRFKAYAVDPKKQADADDMLAREVVVHPSAETFAQWVERRPGLTLKVAACAAEIAQGDEAHGAKKLLKRSPTSASAGS